MFSRYYFVLAALILSPLTLWADPGTAFSYQGRLANGSVPIETAVDLRFSLWDDPTSGSGTQIGSDIAVLGTAYDGGIIQTSLDFGMNAINGDARFLEIEVRDPADPADTLPYTILSGRIPLLPVPYAIKATRARGVMGPSGTDSGLIIDDDGNLVFEATPTSDQLSKVGALGIPDLNPIFFADFIPVGTFIVTFDFDGGGGGTLAVFDSADPTNITPVPGGILPLPDPRLPLFDSAVVGSSIFGVSDNVPTLIEIQLDAAGVPSIPNELAGFFSDPFFIEHFDGRLYVCDDGTGEIVEIDAATLTPTGTSFTIAPEIPEDIVAHNGVLYVILPNGILPLDISAPGLMTQISSPVFFPALNDTFSGIAQGNYLYILDDIFAIFDISDPTNITQVGQLPPQPGINSMGQPGILNDNVLALNSFVGDIRRFDIANPLAVNDLGAVPGTADFFIQHVAANRLYAFTAGASFEICIFEFLTVPTLVDVMTVTGDKVNITGDLMVSGDLMGTDLILTGNLFVQDIFANDLFVDDIDMDNLFANDLDVDDILADNIDGSTITASSGFVGDGSALTGVHNTSLVLNGMDLELADGASTLTADLSPLAGTVFGDGHSLDAADGSPVDVVFVNAAGEVDINAGSGTVGGDGGDISLLAGEGDDGATGGAIAINAGTVNVLATSGTGGPVSIEAGAGFNTGDGGELTLLGGDSGSLDATSTGSGGDVRIEGGSGAELGDGGDILLVPGAPGLSGGSSGIVDITGDVNASGTVTANAFVGDGSGLTGIPDNVDDADPDPTNELQTLSGAGSEISLSDGGGTLRPSALAASDGNPADALIVDADGNVGIGTTTPQAGLHITKIVSTTPSTETGILRDDSVGGTANALGGSVDVVVSGNAAWVISAADDSLTRVDISDPSNPIQTGFITDNIVGGTATGLDSPTSIEFAGGFVYTTSFADDVFSRFTTGATPTESRTISDDTQGGTATMLNGPTDCKVVGNLAYVTAQEDNAFVIINLTANPAAFFQQSFIRDDEVGGTATALEDASGVDVLGTFAYVTADADDALTIFNIGSGAPVELSVLIDDTQGGTATGLNGATDALVVGSVVYVASLDGLSVIDVTNPLAPVEVTVITAASGPGLGGTRALALEGSTLYAAVSSADSVAAFDISNPLAPAFLYSIIDDNRGGPAIALDAPRGVAAAGGLLYTTSLVDSSLSIFGGAQDVALRVENGIAAKDSGPMWSTFSDLRLKQNVAPLNGSLGRIQALHPVEFQYGAEWSEAFGRPAPRGQQAGFIAQEYREVFPQDVTHDPASGYLAIDPSSALPHMVRAIQELAEENRRLREELEQNAELESRIDRLEELLQNQGGME